MKKITIAKERTGRKGQGARKNKGGEQMATKEITVTKSVDGNSQRESSALALRPCRVANVSCLGLFDWGMGLGAALSFGHLPAGPCGGFDPPGRPPST